MTKQIFIIKDWFGNVWDYKNRVIDAQIAVPMEFNSFDEAHEYLFRCLAEKPENEELSDKAFEELLEEFYIEEKQ